MTPKQIQQFNTMLETLKRIAGKSKWTNYMTTEQLRRGAEKDGFMEFEEVIEMTYENIQGDAWSAIRGVRSVQEAKPKTEVKS